MTQPSDNELVVKTLLETPTLAIRDVGCSGGCRHKSPTEWATELHLVFAYRGLFMRHVRSKQTIAEPAQLVFFNEDEEYSVSHPVAGGDRCLSIALDPAAIRELAPPGQFAAGSAMRARDTRRGIDSKAQMLLASLRHGLTRGTMDRLEAEGIALTLVRRSLGDTTSHVRATTYGREKLVDRTKLLLAADPRRRWTLAAIAREVGVSPVYLTQVFTQVEGMPLYRYHLKARLAHALDLIVECPDLTTVALDLGFSSHSHFTAAFRKIYGHAPTAFRLSARLR